MCSTPYQDAQHDLSEAFVWWFGRYIKENCDPNADYEENMTRARLAFCNKFNVQLIDVLQGTIDHMIKLTNKVRSDV